MLHLVLLIKRLVLLLFKAVGVMLSGQSLVLGVDFFLELTNLILGNSELFAKLNDLIVGKNQVLTVEVTIRAHNFVQVLLLLELTLELDVLFLQLADQVALQLNLLDHLHQVGVGLVGSLRLLLLLTLDLANRLDQALDVLLVGLV